MQRPRKTSPLTNLFRLHQAQRNLPPGIELVKADDFREWQVDIRVLDASPLYLNQTFRLNFTFSDTYPLEAPEVIFIYLPPSPTDPTRSGTAAPLSMPSQPTPAPPESQSQSQTSSTASQGAAPFPGRPIPIHPHIYSNGVICLDLLGSAGWSPVQSVESVCMSIQSMLTGNTRNERPQGDEQFCQSMGVRGPDGWGSSSLKRGLRDVRFAYDDDTV